MKLRDYCWFYKESKRERGKRHNTKKIYIRFVEGSREAIKEERRKERGCI